MSLLDLWLGRFDKSLPVYIAVHERPDGDAVGSQTALTLYLNRLGFSAFAVITEEIRDVLCSFFNNVPSKPLEAIDVNQPASWVALDCGTASRLHEALRSCCFRLVIDHHPEVDDEKWGETRYVDSNASSTCEILTFLLSQDDYRFNDPYINESLYLGILTDSGNFTHNNVTQHTFECAEQLVGAGVQPSKIFNKLFSNKTKEQLKLQGLFLNNVTLHHNGAIAVSTLSQQDYKNTHTCHNDTEGFVNQLLTLKNAKISVFIEYNETFVKGSLRSISPSIPINEVARKWNGGGHVCAAGFRWSRVSFNLEELIHDLDSLLEQ